MILILHAIFSLFFFFFFQAEDGIRDLTVTGVQTCALPICRQPCCSIRRSAASMIRSRSLGGAAAPPETRGERPFAIAGPGQLASSRDRAVAAATARSSK